MQKIVLWSKHSYITQKLLPEHLSSFVHLQPMLEEELTLFFFWPSCFSFHYYAIYRAPVSTFAPQNVALFCMYIIKYTWFKMK